MELHNAWHAPLVTPLMARLVVVLGAITFASGLASLPTNFTALPHHASLVPARVA